MFHQQLVELAGYNSTAMWQGAGDVQRTPIWTFYTFMNTLAFYFNFTLMFTLFRMESKTTTDLLIGGGLCGGIIVSSLGCGPFCLVSLITGTFAGGKIACVLESFGHIIGMVVSFLSIAAIAHRTYVAVVKNEPFTARQAYLTIAIIYLISIGGTIVSGQFSPSYLVESGTFCFFDWSSRALTTFAWPVALIAGLCMIYWYYQTFKRVREIQRDAKQFNENDQSQMTRQIAKRLVFLVLLFFCSYATIMSLSFYELSGRRAGSFYDIFAATTVLIYWVSAPVAYAYINKNLTFRSVICLPICITVLDYAHVKSKDSNQSVFSTTSSHHSKAVESMVTTTPYPLVATRSTKSFDSVDRLIEMSQGHPRYSLDETRHGTFEHEDSKFEEQPETPPESESPKPAPEQPDSPVGNIHVELITIEGPRPTGSARIEGSRDQGDDPVFPYSVTPVADDGALRG